MSIDTEADALLAEIATSTPTRLRALLIAALRQQRDAGDAYARGVLDGVDLRADLDRLRAIEAAAIAVCRPPDSPFLDIAHRDLEARVAVLRATLAPRKESSRGE